MTPAEVLTAARATGVTLWADGDALRYRGPREALTADLLAQFKVHKAGIQEALAAPPPYIPPYILREFGDRLSSEDRADIEAGDIPGETVQQFEQGAIAREADDLKEHFEERAAILEHDAGMPCPDAELEAARITSTLARNRGYLWASLRSALAGYPLLHPVPDTAGKVDALPWGVAQVQLKDKRVLRQGTFTGAPEVKP